MMRQEADKAEKGPELVSILGSFGCKEQRNTEATLSSKVILRERCSLKIQGEGQIRILKVLGFVEAGWLAHLLNKGLLSATGYTVVF